MNAPLLDGSTDMSNPGLAKCVNCLKPIEHRFTNFGWVWQHRGSNHALCDPYSLDNYKFAVPA